MLFINFKAYEQSTGKKAIELAKAAEKAAQETGKEVILVVQAVDIKEVSQSVNLKIYAQHVDEVEYGSQTGHTLIDSVKQAGAVGAIINHSENRIPIEKIKSIVEKCKEKKFPILVCAQDPSEVEAISKLAPDYVAYEPPELIGGDISVSTAKPELIEESVSKASSVPLVVGAGVKNRQDVEISVKLGAKGILVASGVVKADDQEAAVKDLLEGF